jgi:hypothetical protein
VIIYGHKYKKISFALFIERCNEINNNMHTALLVNRAATG